MKIYFSISCPNMFLSIYFIFASLRAQESLILFQKCYKYQWTMSKLCSQLLLHLRLKQLLFFLLIVHPLPSLSSSSLDSWFFPPLSLRTGDKMIHDEIPSHFIKIDGIAVLSPENKLPHCRTVPPESIKISVSWQWKWFHQLINTFVKHLFSARHWASRWGRKKRYMKGVLTLVPLPFLFWAACVQLWSLSF